ncbi:MAG: HAD-IIA family hydrolase [Candidatus Sumerlaeia bacterium]|nr:HAD-IIA family hydrolase [Candidatus Sumerlaeia bacterium]
MPVIQSKIQNPRFKVLASIRHLALDMDGTLYRGATLFHFTRPFLAQMDAQGIAYTFLTNNSSKSVADYLAHLQRLGITARADQIRTSMHCTVDYLRTSLPGVRRLYILGTPSLRREFAEAGFEDVGDEGEPDAVVVGFDTGLTFPRLCKTAWWITHGKPFIATHPDNVCPTDQPTVLVDCGSVCACLERATGRAPDAVLGKPDPWMLRGILERHGLAPHQLAMVGDRLYTDMAMARRAGAVGVLVLTGEATAEQAARCTTPPDLVVPSLKELGEMFEEIRRTSDN